MATSNDCSKAGICTNVGDMGCVRTAFGIAHIMDHNKDCHMGCQKPYKPEQKQASGKHRRPKN